MLTSQGCCIYYTRRYIQKYSEHSAWHITMCRIMFIFFPSTKSTGRWTKNIVTRKSKEMTLKTAAPGLGTLFNLSSWVALLFLFRGTDGYDNCLILFHRF